MTQENQTQGLLLDPEPVAQQLGIAVGTLGVWRSTGRHGLPFVKVGSRVKYRQSDVSAWLASRVRTATTV